MTPETAQTGHIRQHGFDIPIETTRHREEGPVEIRARLSGGCSSERRAVVVRAIHARHKRAVDHLSCARPVVHMVATLGFKTRGEPD